MPVVTFTADEKRAFNASGDERGCRKCANCSDSMSWKAFHDTPHFEGQLPGHGTTPVVKSAVVLCEECFARLTPEHRLPHYMALVDTRLAELRSIIRHRKPTKIIANPDFVEYAPESDENPRTIATSGDWYDCPKDAARHAREAAAVEAEREAIRAAVLAGK